MEPQMHVFNNGPELAEKLAADVAERLKAAIEERGAASIAVSGGSTPKLFFQALSRHSLEWPQVSVTLVDERFVPADSDRSNHKLVADNLLQNEAKAAYFVPLYQSAASPEDAATLATAKTADICDPFDIVILGMGTDGHTASFFPGGDNLEEALDLDEPRSVLPMEAEGAGEERLTFNLSALHDASFLVLHIEGAAKKETLEKAQSDLDEDEMPIRSVLNRADSTVNIYWAP
ncbi:6-phosphogluconolactonase [Agrobacterium larrymoorei]|uniref:6-phosphogluconolactonase n=1 Tax=Agrobacterium larrymoorei TaxID=160699 RepID=A0A4D7E259_9HYPH|nr:6-phosphogluconolactonase [Agrobacterium larrymoorei]QCI98670.1 6-phosphogluconolactonase [Agrobacterium larrymoorei]QYA05864.1 6-phosphogluconolactonase [Agrobacterium larrymoorei]